MIPAQPEKSNCEVCGRGLDRRTAGGICQRCREAGAIFRRRWMGDLVAGGCTYLQAAKILDCTETSPALVREAARR